MLISHGTRPSSANLEQKIKYRRRNVVSAFNILSPKHSALQMAFALEELFVKDTHEKKQE